jgi:predicted aldo/keto reductase-like oxidoreductase
MDEIIALYESPRPLSKADRTDIGKIREDLGKRFCHRCGYCLPCEQGVRIPEVMSFQSILKRFHPPIAIVFSQEAMTSVDACTDCGDCLKRCPYTLPIPDMLRENQALFHEASRHRG